MNRNRLASVFGAAVLAGALATTGCASAAARTAAARTAATTRQSPAAAGGKVHLMVYSINSDGPDFRAILAGAVGDYGPAVTVYPDGKVDPEHSSEMELKLAHGSFRVSIAGIDKSFVKATSHEPIYPRTCSDFVSVSGAVPVVAGSGTGSYRGISGSLTVTATLHEAEVKPCGASSKGTFLTQAIVLAGTGTLSF